MEVRILLKSHQFLNLNLHRPRIYSYSLITMAISDLTARLSTLLQSLSYLEIVIFFGLLMVFYVSYV